MRGRGGYTLFELLVVLFLLSILAALAAPSYSRSIVSARLRASASDVRSVFGKARASAVAKGTECAVVLDPEEGTFRLEKDMVFRRLEEPVRLGTVRVSGEEKPGGKTRVAFYPDGTAQEAEVSVETADGGAIRVKVDPLTGIAEALP